MTCQLEIEFDALAEAVLSVDVERREIVLSPDIGETPVSQDADVIGTLRKIREDYGIALLDDWKIRLKDVYLIITNNKITGVRL